MTTATPIYFAVLAPAAALEPWQQECVCELQRIPGVALIEERDAARLRHLDLDFILSWTSPPAELLDIPRYGVWSYRFGDSRHGYGEPDGFWEVHEGRPVSTATLARLTVDPDAVIVLREIHLRTNLLSVAKNRRQLEKYCALLAPQLCVDIGNRSLARFTSKPRRTATRVRPAPTAGQLLLHRLRIGARLVARAWTDLFRYDQWTVGIVEQPIEAFLTPAKRAVTQWVPEPPAAAILADPFGALHDGRLTVFCERLDPRNDRGVIVAIQPSRTGPPTPTPVEFGPHPQVHLSYPYLIETGGRTFCIPETHQAREVGLYELERFPDRWRKVATLLSDTVIVDTTPFTYGGLWWLAGSEAAPRGANCELHLWYATELAGPWRPHPGNPVKIDARSARPGGTPFMHEGALYRPAQDCSSTYGGRIVINRVTTLTPTAFEEDFAAAVDPDRSGPYPEGLHTLSAVGAVTLIDGKRIRFASVQLTKTLGSWLRHAVGSGRSAGTAKSPSSRDRNLGTG